jgi:hypothetical protein
MDLIAVARKFVHVGSGGSPHKARMTDHQSLVVASMELPKMELARAGKLFQGGNQIIANGIAPVTAIPTTTATLLLYNSADAGGTSLVIDRIGFWLGSGTPTAGATLLGAVSTSAIVTAPTAHGTGYGVQSQSGSGLAQSRALWTTAATMPSMTNRAPAWMQIQSTFQLAAANVGQGDWYSEMWGSLIVPPKYGLGLAILSGTGTTPLYGVSATWAELQLSLE